MGRQVRSQYDLEDELLNLRILILRTMSEVWKSDVHADELLDELLLKEIQQLFDSAEICDRFIDREDTSSNSSNDSSKEDDTIEFKLFDLWKAVYNPNHSLIVQFKQERDSFAKYVYDLLKKNYSLEGLLNVFSIKFRQMMQDRLHDDLIDFSEFAIRAQFRSNLGSDTNTSLNMLTENVLKEVEKLNSAIDSKIESDRKHASLACDQADIAHVEAEEFAVKAAQTQNDVEKQEYLKEKQKRLSLSLEKQKEAANYEGYPSFKAIIDNAAENGILRNLIEALSISNLKAFWVAQFGEPMQFHDFGVQIIRPTARWNVYSDNKWTKPNTEALYVSLPMELGPYETSDNEGVLSKHIERLTQYYRRFPSFLGRDFGNSSGPEDTKKFEVISNIMADTSEPIVRFRKDVTLDTKDLSNLYARNSYGGNNYDLGIANDQFLSFSSVLIKLIPTLWNDNTLRYRLNYMQRLTDELSWCDAKFNPNEDSLWYCKNKGMHLDFTSIRQLSYVLGHQNTKFTDDLECLNESYNNELRAILKEHFSYESPWVFNIRFIYRPMSYFYSDLAEENQTIEHPGKIPYDNVPNITTIEIPFAPSKTSNENEIALALARYNATGPAYPFTCS